MQKYNVAIVITVAVGQVSANIIGCWFLMAPTLITVEQQLVKLKNKQSAVCQFKENLKENISRLCNYSRNAKVNSYLTSQFYS